MSTRITIDPITRIEGHLRIDLEVDGGKVSRAYSSGTMWRGIEVILQGRDPRDAWVFTQRICGVCTTVHAIASVRSVESALGLEIPLNAQLIRNIIISAHAQHDHIVHFYHLSALDWVDVVSALKADVGATAALAAKISDWPGNSAKALGAVKEKLTSFVKAGQLGPFTNGYWGHPAMKLSPEVNLLAVAHYLQALDIQRKANQVVAILGSKTPNIQNLAVGGVANAINLDNPATLNMERLYKVKSLLEEIQAFTTQCYLVDVAAVAGFYPDWFKYGAGVTNYLAVPDMPTDAAMSKFDLPGGIIMTGAKDVQPITDWKKTQPFIGKVTEGVSRSYYEGKESRHPWQGETKPYFKAEEINWKPETAAPEKYTWVKAPRLDGKPMQVGPLAQVLVGFLTGHELTTKYVTAAIKAVKAIHNIDVTPAMLHSTLGRHAARAIRCAMMGELSLKHWGLLAANIGKGDTAIFVDPMANLKAGTVYEGVGLHEAPRGTLSHWCVIESDGKGMKLKNYQAVVPSTWNAGPRDDKDQAGPYEACLVGNPIADPKLPLEALRTIHSFDPCLACAIHTHDVDGNEIGQVKVGV